MAFTIQLTVVNVAPFALWCPIWYCIAAMDKLDSSMSKELLWAKPLSVDVDPD